MINEGLIINDTAALLKSEMVKQIRRLRSATPDELERAVFAAIVAHEREDVDWEIEGNQAGYYTWMRSFDQFITELIEDGYIRVEEERGLVATEADPSIEYSHLAYPSAREK